MKHQSTTPSMLDDVVEFHDKILGIEPPDSPTLITQEFVIERGRFMTEELEEYFKAGMTGDIVATADALADIIYVALGTAHMMGLPFKDIWDHVHRANMRKVRGVTKRGNLVDAKKPADWVPPEAGIAALILGRINDAPLD